MKQALLLLLSVSAAAALSAQQPVLKTSGMPSTTTVKVKATPEKTVRHLGGKTSVTYRSAANGLTVKQINNYTPNRRIAPARAPQHEAPANASFWESFEYEAGESPWIAESKGSFTTETQWAVAEPDILGMLGITPPDGSKALFINFNSEPIEEWYISPEFTVAAGNQLSFWLYCNPVFFNSTDNVDWDTMDYIGDPVRLGDIEVMARKDGGEWTKIFSMMDFYGDLTFNELLSTESCTPSISLADFEGEHVQIAFRYYGTDCNSAAVDVVKVAPPSMDGVLHMEPLDVLYWGADRSSNWSSLNLTLAIAPVQAPLTWINFSDPVDGASYYWTYHNPETNDLDISTDEDLTVTYAPDFTSDFTRRNNLYYAPVLTGSAPGCSDGSYSRGYTYLQAGGKPEFSVSGGLEGSTIMDFGLLPYPMNIDGNTVLLIDDATVGDPALPVFGHNANVDKYWLNYTLNGDEPSEGDYVKLNGICNFISAPGKPMVVTGTHLLAVGQLSEAAEFRCDIYALTEDSEIFDENIIATAYCPYSQMIIGDAGVNKSLNIPFDFDTPVVLDNSVPGYVVKISGFNSDAVTFFAPVQSEQPDPVGICFGYIEKLMNISGYSEGERSSFTPIAYVETENGPCFNSFAIHLDAYYPFLACETTEIDFPDSGEPVQVNLGSYYDASDLTVDAPACLDASVEGRYDSCILTLTPKDKVSGVVTVSAPGVEHQITVSGAAGIEGIAADSTDAAITEVYTLDGRRIAVSEATSGLYIVRRADGSAAKLRIK